MLNKVLTEIKESILRLPSYFAIFQVCIIFGIMLNILTYRIVSLAYFQYTYIQEINTPSYGEYTKDILREFNYYGDNKIISFTKVENGRPITISEMTTEEMKARPNVLGSAMPKLDSCDIVIANNLDWYTYKDTLLHEYLHCMGYNHSAYKWDLMYYMDNSIDKTLSIRYYARMVRVIYYE